MTIGKGFEGILGIARETSWGDAVEVTEAIPFVSEAFSREIEKHADEVLRGKAGAGASIAGNKSYPFSIPCKLTYEDLDLLIAIAMGGAGSPEENGDLYDNTYSLAENLNYFFTAAVYKGVSVWEYAGCKIDSMKISGEANKPLDIEFGGVAKELALDSETNTSVILTALDTEDDASKIMMSDLEFKIAAQGDALSEESEKGISSFELNLSNNMALDQFDNQEELILEPQRNGFREIKFNFVVPRYEADTYQDWRTSDTALHAQLIFTSGNYVFEIHLPKIKIDVAGAPVDGPGLIGQNIECTCFRDPGSVSASFTVTDEMEIDVTNARAASPLA
jgi:hypothetical protein